MGGSQSSTGGFSILDSPLTTATNAATVTSRPIAAPTAAPTTSTAKETSGPNDRNKNVGIIVGGILVGGLGFGLLVGGLVLCVRRRRLKKIDAGRLSEPYLILDGGEKPPRIGMAEASILRARYGGVEPFVLPLASQTPAIPRMEKAALFGDVTVLQQSTREPSSTRPADLTPSESGSRTRTEKSGLAIAVPSNNTQRAKKRPLLESIMFPKTALPPYPGSPYASQYANT